MSKAAFIILLLSVTWAVAGLPPGYSYEELTEKADVIVIARPMGARDTTERTNFPGVEFRNHTPMPARGVETTFEVLAVLKGKLASNPITPGDVADRTNYHGLGMRENGELSSEEKTRLKAISEGKLQKLVLHHLQLDEEAHAKTRGDSYSQDPLRPWCLIKFPPQDNFLMFLKQEPDGRYAAASGHSCPCASIKPLDVMSRGVAVGATPARAGAGIFPGRAGRYGGGGYGTPPNVPTNPPPGAPSPGTPQSTPSK